MKKVYCSKCKHRRHDNNNGMDFCKSKPSVAGGPISPIIQWSACITKNEFNDCKEYRPGVVVGASPVQPLSPSLEAKVCEIVDRLRLKVPAIDSRWIQEQAAWERERVALEQEMERCRRLVERSNREMYPGLFAGAPDEFPEAKKASWYTKAWRWICGK